VLFSVIISDVLHRIKVELSNVSRVLRFLQPRPTTVTKHKLKIKQKESICMNVIETLRVLIFGHNYISTLDLCVVQKHTV